MSKCYSPRPWNELAAGIGMLGIIVFITFLCLGSKLGFGKAIGCIVLGVFITIWVIVGVVFIVHGISKL